MLSKILGGGMALSLVACFILYNLWENTQAEMVQLKANAEILESVNQSNQQAMDRLTKLAADNADSIAELGKQNESILQHTLSQQAEINKLRATEAQAALARPFERGNASHKRIAAQLMRFSGNSSGESKVDSGDDKTIDSDGSNSP